VRSRAACERQRKQVSHEGAVAKRQPWRGFTSRFKGLTGGCTMRLSPLVSFQGGTLPVLLRRWLVDRALWILAITAWCSGIWAGYAVLINENDNLSWHALQVVFFAVSPVLVLLMLACVYLPVYFLFLLLRLPFILVGRLVKALTRGGATLGDSASWG
jgi:hypothetical protein